MGFQWDPAKDAANRKKHRIGFREAAEVFCNFILVTTDARRDYGEQRRVALGEYDGDVIRVVFTECDGDIRIISAWKANRHDRETYQEEGKARSL